MDKEVPGEILVMIFVILLLAIAATYWKEIVSGVNWALKKMDKLGPLWLAVILAVLLGLVALVEATQ